MTVSIIHYAQFINNAVGATGLTVTVDVDRYTRSSAARSQIVTAGSATEGTNGVYYYQIAAADLTLYDYVVVFKTSGTADQKNIPSMWTSFSLDNTAPIAAIPTTVAPTVTAIRTEMDSNSTRLANLDATISGVSASVWAAATRTLTAISDSSGITTLLARIASALTITGGKVDVNDKTGFALSSGEHTNIATDVQAGMTAQGATTTRMGYLDTLSGLVAAVWAAATRTLTAISDSAGVTTLLSRLTSGRAGNLDNLDASVNSRLASASYTAPDNADIAAIKAKTDNLPSDPASNTYVGTRLPTSSYVAAPTASQIDTQLSSSHGAGTWGGASGSGSSIKTITVESNTNGLLEGVDVWITTGANGSGVVASAKTNTLGQATFYLDPGTYYVWKQLGGYNFTNPETMVVT